MNKIASNYFSKCLTSVSNIERILEAPNITPDDMNELYRESGFLSHMVYKISMCCDDIPDLSDIEALLFRAKNFQPTNGTI